MVDSKKNLITQGNKLIEAAYKIQPVNEHRLIRMLMSYIHPDDEDFKTYSISIKDYIELFELSSMGGNWYELIKESARNLAKREIVILSYDEKGNEVSTEIFHWFSYVKIIKKSGVIELRFDKVLKPYLLGLKNHFTQYPIKNIIHLRNSHSIKLYEMLKSNQFKQDKSGYFKVTFDTDELRAKLGFYNSEMYPLFADFRKRIIEQAVKEINSNDDFLVSQIDYPRTGNKITHIVFHCQKAVQQKIQFEETPILKEVKKSEHPQCVKDLILMGIDEATAYKWKKKFGVKRILRSVAYTQGMKKAGKIRDSVTGFLSRTIHDDISLAWENEQKAKQEKRAEEVKQEQAQRQAEEIRVSQDREKRAEVWGQFLALSEEEQGQIIELVTTSKTILKQQYTKAGLESKAVQMEIIAHMKKM